VNICIQLLSGGIVNRGAEHSMLMLAEDLVKLGHKVTVFQAGDPSNETYHVETITLPVTPTSHKPTTFLGKVLERLYLNQRGLLSLLFSIKTASQLKQFDVIIPTDGFWSVMIAKWFKQKKAKVVCVGLAGMGWTDADTLKLHPDVFVALSTKAAKWAKSIAKNVIVHTIPLQVDSDMFKHAVPLLPQTGKPIVLTIAALTKYKRVDLVIQAIAAIPDCILLIVGQGEAYDQIHTLCEKLLPNRYLIKTVDFGTLPRIYKTAKVFALLSDPQEAFGQVLVEAMAAGLPIVTTDDPIRREIVGSQGIYVNPQDNQSVVEAITKALREPQPTYEIDRFDRQTIAKQYEKLF